VVGAGAIGMEFGYFYHSYGTEVTVVEMQDRILPVEDEDISKAMERSTRRRASTSAPAHHDRRREDQERREGHDRAHEGRQARREEGRDLEGDRVLLAIGVKGRFDGLFDDALGLETVKDHIKTDYVPLGPNSEIPQADLDYKTNLPGVYAVGDVIGPPWLAHVASEEAILCVERIAWRKDQARPRADPDRLLDHPRVHLLPPAGRRASGSPSRR
jgi:dihydrolipoamide dehydrogenase